MTLKPYKLRLQKVSSNEQRLLSAIYEYLPATGIADEVIEGIKQAIDRHVGQECSFHLEAVYHETFFEYSTKIPESTVLAVFGMAPLNKKALCEIDPILAIALIERLLGGHPSMNLNIRKLSDTEEGVLQYLILQVLSSIYRTCGNNARVHFRFDRFISEASALDNFVSRNDGIALLVFRMKIGRHSGFIRLAFPNPFIEEGFLNIESAGDDRRDEREYGRRLLSRFDYIKVPVWAEVGRLTLLPEEIASLEEGDVVLLDESSVQLVDGRMKGRAVLRFGDGEMGGLDSDFSVEGTTLHCRIEGFHK